MRTFINIREIRDYVLKEYINFLDDDGTVLLTKLEEDVFDTFGKDEHTELADIEGDLSYKIFKTLQQIDAGLV